MATAKVINAPTNVPFSGSGAVRPPTVFLLSLGVKEAKAIREACG
tara:strand:- start:24 stop:158 length:135 start_codon:yes stop_codon:yes gene_type:complete